MAVEYMTAGESHGNMLVGIIRGLPSGLELDEEYIAVELKRRMLGFGRSVRMNAEKDRARIVAGVFDGKTTGAPVCVIIENVINYDCRSDMKTARAGHADLVGAVKYGFTDARAVSERASARNTAITVALGAICKKYLSMLGIHIYSHTVQIGKIVAPRFAPGCEIGEFFERAEKSEVRCADELCSQKMCEQIVSAANAGDTIGGASEIIVTGIKSGVGSYASENSRIDGALASAVMNVPSVKSVEIGCADFSLRGSEYHDTFYPSRGGVMRKTNNAGGTEGGMTDGMPIVIRAGIKPVPTLSSGRPTVNIASKAAASTKRVRSDFCVVPACGVIAESSVALALVTALCDMLGGDTVKEVTKRYAAKESV